MSSITKYELVEFLKDYPDNAEVVINIHHKYDISKESGVNGWISYINGIGYDKEHNEIKLMN